MKKITILLLVVVAFSTSGWSQLHFGLKPHLKLTFQKPDPFYNGKTLVNHIELLKVHPNECLEFKLQYKSTSFEGEEQSFQTRIIVEPQAYQSSQVYQSSFAANATRSYKKAYTEHLENAVPEFILSKKAYAQLVQQNELTLSVIGEESKKVTYKRNGTETLTLLVNGRSQKVTAHVAEKTDAGLKLKEELLILDNPNCPLVLRRTIEWQARKTVEFELKEVGM